MRLLSAAAVSGDSSLAGSGGKVLVALPQPVCLRGEMLYLSYIFNMALQWDVPIVSLVSQWLGKKNLFDRVGWSPILCGGFTHKYAQFT